jgi:uncharacterized protein (DUF2164 family)
VSNKLIDLIAFNETRLDANITDNRINLDIMLEKIDQEMVVEFVSTCVALSTIK